jgi:capsular polysaccharide biosynthesis protein
VLEDNYKSVSKVLGERTVVENVQASRQSSVRVVEPPRPPALPRPLRRLILIGGVLLSVLLAAGATLLGHFFRSIYLRPEALELDTGLPVLATVPETRRLARGAILVSPG